MKSRTGEERETLVNHLLAKQIQGQITLGELLRELRIELTGLNQHDFAKLVGIGRRKLTQLENDESNSTAALLSRVYRPFGLTIGLVPMGSIKERLEAVARELD